MNPHLSDNLTATFNKRRAMFALTTETVGRSDAHFQGERSQRKRI